MHLDNLKTAWKQLKIYNAIQPIGSNEILSIIEEPLNLNILKRQRILLGLVIFFLITIFCQGG
jgi:hypothetical protein